MSGRTMMVGLGLMAGAALLVMSRDRFGTPGGRTDQLPTAASVAEARGARAAPALPAVRPSDGNLARAGIEELGKGDLVAMDRTLDQLTAPCRAGIEELGLAPPVNLPYLVTVGIARGRARVLKVEVNDSTASSAIAQVVPQSLRQCLIERLRTQEWEIGDHARDQVHVHMTALNWRPPGS